MSDKSGKFFGRQFLSVGASPRKTSLLVYEDALWRYLEAQDDGNRNSINSVILQMKNVRKWRLLLQTGTATTAQQSYRDCAR
jgi:hypothetical protein